jgi:hypothetical protein
MSGFFSVRGANPNENHGQNLPCRTVEPEFYLSRTRGGEIKNPVFSTGYQDQNLNLSIQS